MNEKIDWMIGMSENMANIAADNQGMSFMDELHNMATNIRDNLDKMRERELEDRTVDMMEQLMRSMEQVMINMDKGNDQQNLAMKNMMMYMLVLMEFQMG